MISTAVERARTRRAISREPAGNPALLFGVAGVMSRLARTAKGIESEIGAWLAALARCLQLKDEHEILEFDHFLRTAPDAFERHRIALARASQERGERIAAAVRTLTTQMTEADGVAEAHVLLHTSGSRNVIDSVKMPLREAIRDPRQLKSAGVELVRGAGKCAAVAGAFAAVGVLLARALDAVAL